MASRNSAAASTATDPLDPVIRQVQDARRSIESLRAERSRVDTHTGTAARRLRTAVTELSMATTILLAPAQDADPDDGWGPEPSAGEVAAAEEEMRARSFDDRARLVDQSLTRAQVAGLLSVSEPAVTGHLQHDRLLGLKVRGRWAIPRWQLDPDAQAGFLPGLDRLSRAFPGGIVQLSRWVQRPHPDFGGRTPRQALADGRVDEVVDRAATMTATGW